MSQVNVNDKPRWFMVDPDGNAYSSRRLLLHARLQHDIRGGREKLRVAAVDQDEQWKATFNPAAGAEVNFHAVNIVRKYGGRLADDFSARMIDRVRKFGFNSGGAFGSRAPGQAKATFACVSGMRIGRTRCAGVAGHLAWV